MAASFFTQDVDILIDSAKENLLAALRALVFAGFELECNGEPVVLDAWLAARLLEGRVVVTARKESTARIDVVLESGGMSFADWDRSARRFRVAGALVRVGGLADLIRAKQRANRDKDRKFLVLYKAQLNTMLKRERNRGKG